MRRDYTAHVEGIRRTRLHPRRTDDLYLHLRRLRDDIRSAVADLDARDVLDVFCGAKPYAPLFGRDTNYVGLDIDNAYGCADVVSPEFLPFDDESFDLVLCTQAFYFVPTPEAAVDEFARVLRPDGHAVLTVPVAYPGTQRLYSAEQLRALFAAWHDVCVVENGRTAVSAATLATYFVHQIEKRVPRVLRPLFLSSYVLMNVAGDLADLFERRYLASAASLPTNLLVRAKRQPRTD